MWKGIGMYKKVMKKVKLRVQRRDDMQLEEFFLYLEYFYIWSTLLLWSTVHYRTHDLSLFLKSFHPMKYFKQGDVILSNIYN